MKEMVNDQNIEKMCQDCERTSHLLNSEEVWHQKLPHLISCSFLWGFPMMIEKFTLVVIFATTL